MAQHRWRYITLGGVVVVGWIAVRLWTALVPDLWWFSALSQASGGNYTRVFTTVLWTKIAVGAVVGLALMFTAFLNIWLVHRFAPRTFHRSVAVAFPFEVGERDLRSYVRNLLYALSAVFSVLLGYSATARWEVIQRYLHREGITFRDAAGEPLRDLVFGQNVAFYVFDLPFREFVSGWLLGVLLPLAIVVTLLYFFYGALLDARNQWNIRRPVRVHVGVLFALAFLALAWRHRLDMYGLLYTDQDKWFGAGDVEVHARLPVLWILLSLAVIAAVAYFAGVMLNRLTPALLVTGAYVAMLFIGGGFYPQIYQRFRVKPNEQNLQRRYIAESIRMTRHAFGLDHIREVNYSVQGELSLDHVQSPALMRNVRLWDPRPLLEVYQQAQELRPQYDFADVDLDRYRIGDTVRQVYVAAREIEASQLPAGAQTWVNRTFNFTHGYGIVVTPVNEVEEGKPRYFLRDIPLVTAPAWEERLADTPGPRIYFGEKTAHYVIVHPGATAPQEFDHPTEGEQFAKSAYQGKGGVPIGSLARRLTYAVKFGEYNILLSDLIQRGSRILYHRNVLDAVEKVAPFLRYDLDPYLVIADGRLYWMVDAYVTTYRYPFSRPLQDAFRAFIRQTRGRGAAERTLPRGVPWGNYLRNSVKVIVDAYDGAITFYRLDQDPALLDDPVLEAYARIFPTLFRPFSDMPQSLRRHIRYPRSLFWLQAAQLTSYHMNDPDTFYLDEDLWEMSYEIYEEEPHPVEPYYVTMALPGQDEQPEFLLIYPFTPRDKPVMSAWMAARCDYREDGSPRQYGQISLFRFPKGSQMVGPEQWESEFLANAEFSNWKKVQSADVRRGNLLIFPLPEGVLAVEPIYLRSPATPIPMLRQVMAGYVTSAGETGQIRSMMGANLEEALLRLLGPGEGPVAIAAATEVSGSPTAARAPDTAATPETLLRQVEATYQRAREALRQEKWVEYGREMENLGRILKRTTEKTSR
jgi:uncharacterized membrane protein (UPF0182 family)